MLKLYFLPLKQIGTMSNLYRSSDWFKSQSNKNQFYERLAERSKAPTDKGIIRVQFPVKRIFTSTKIEGSKQSKKNDARKREQEVTRY